LEHQGIDFLAKGNKFVHIADYQEAQRILDDQLNGLVSMVFPMMPQIPGPHLSYYWTMWQSEWATDLIFASPDKQTTIGQDQSPTPNAPIPWDHS
jgi:hypothetical protein